MDNSLTTGIAVLASGTLLSLAVIALLRMWKEQPEGLAAVARTALEKASAHERSCPQHIDLQVARMEVGLKTLGETSKEVLGELRGLRSDVAKTAGEVSGMAAALRKMNGGS
jgi:hypothetical protein